MFIQKYLLERIYVWMQRKSVMKILCKNLKQLECKHIFYTKKVATFSIVTIFGQCPENIVKKIKTTLYNYARNFESHL